MARNLEIDKKHALNNVRCLIEEGKILLTESSKPTSKTSKEYLLSSSAYWFWTTITVAFATSAIVFFVPGDANSMAYVRIALGVVFIFWLPGYAFIKALFPVRAPVTTSSEELDTIVRIALSVGMSMALVPIVGLVLNYTPFGVTLTPITLSLLALTVAFAVAGIIRQQQATIRSRSENEYE
jgi:archaellum biogenesis protein FlaJ (TadC family)